MPRGMSAFGTKRKSKVCLLMSTFGGIAGQNNRGAKA
jgi:hypothetical protein